MELTLHEKSYYQEMAQKDRLVSFYDNNKLAYILTFYIGNDNDKDKFVRKDMWSVVEDNPDGDICFIDHLITNKNIDIKIHPLKIWKIFNDFLQNTFPKIEKIRWIRWKNNKRYIFNINKKKVYA